MLLRLFVGQSLRQCRGLLQRRLLRGANLFGVALQGVRRLRTRLAADQLPGRVDDVLLQLGELLSVLGVLALALLLLLLPFALLLLAAGRLLALAEDLFERPHFGEVHVAQRAAQLAVGIAIFGPPVIRQQLIRLGLQFFELQLLGQFVLLLRGSVLQGTTSTGGWPLIE